MHWDLSLLRSPNNWEEESACNILAKLADMEVTPQGNDELVWPHDPKKFFNIKSFCNALHDRSSCFDFPLIAIWRSKAPSKAFFLLLGQPAKKKFQQRTSLKEEISMGLVGVLCA